MFRSVFLKNLRDQRRGIIGWGIGIVAIVLVMAAVWPSIRDMPDLDKFLAAYPEAMRELFNIESMTSGPGFLNAELFSIMLPLAFVIFAVARGARLVAGEEETGQLELVLTTGLSRIQLFLEKALALIAALVILAVVTFTSTWALAGAFDMGVEAADLLVGTTGVLLLGIEFGMLALAVGAVTGKRSLALAAGAGAATASYLLYVVGSLVPSVEPWQVVSPFHQALEAGPLGGGWTPGMIWMPLVALLILSAAIPRYRRRDIVTG